jgi:glycine cleavage system H protein
MNIPESLYYTKDHEWLRVDGDVATVGITDFAQGELGDVVFVELEPAGSELDRDAVFGTVEAVKTVSELFLPVSGTIESINEELDANPEMVNDDPYGKGWMVRVTMSDPSQVEDLLGASEYSDMVGA